MTTDQLPAAKGNPDPQDEGKEGSDADKSTQPHHWEFGWAKIQNSDANFGIQKKNGKIYNMGIGAQPQCHHPTQDIASLIEMYKGLSTTMKKTITRWTSIRV